MDPAAVDLAPASRRGSILVVEDDPDIRETLRDVLEIEGYEVTTAEHGKDALDKLARMARPCLVLLDLMMPVMSGAEFLAVLRKDEVLSTLPVVVVSAWPKEAAKVRDAQGFVKKPVDLDALLRLMGQYC